MGNYYIPANYFFTHISNITVLNAPKITFRTIELGSKFSPDFVCTPFKYTLGTFIECLEKGANVLIQYGGGCRYGYYHELQEKILKDLGYNFKYINLIEAGTANGKKIYKDLKEIDNNIKLKNCLYYLLIASKMVKYMDIVDNYIRKNIGFEIKKGEFEKLNNEMLNKFSKVKSFHHLKKTYKKYFKKIKKVKVNKNNVLKVGIIGELYTLMEPFSNYFLEQELSIYNIEITRFTNVHYLLFEKGKKVKKYLKNTKEYAKYKMGADALDNIGRAKEMCLKNYDGIIHIKSSFCTPEIGSMQIIQKICKNYDVPVVFFSFDANTSETGLKTRIEAFYEMIEMRKKNEMLSRN